MFLAWVVFPIVLTLVSTGCGLAIERLSGWRFPGAVLPGIGLAVVIAVATLTTDHPWSASATTPAVCVVALVGYAVSIDRVRRLRPNRAQCTLAVAVFAVCAAPVVATGQASFLGYFTDTDQAFHLELTAFLLQHGRDLSAAPLQIDNSVNALLREYLTSGYPLGADVGLGALRPLVRQDLAWLLAPYLGCFIAAGALALDELLDGVVAARGLRALCAFVSALGGLTYAFYLQSGIKEVAAFTLITLTVVFVTRYLRRPRSPRGLVPIAVLGVAGLDVFSLTIAPWIGIPLLVLGVGILWRQRHAWRRRWRIRPVLEVVVLAGLTAAFVSPSLSQITIFASIVSSVLGSPHVLGNLAAPLSKWQVLGIWPSGDFRFHPVQHLRVIHVLLWLALFSGSGGALWLLWRRAWAPLLLLASNVIAAVYLLGRADPYSASKVLMLVSPVIGLTTMLGAAALIREHRRTRWLGWAVAIAIFGGVVWTDALGYHDSSIAPRTEMGELAGIGHRFTGQSPAFFDLWDTVPVYLLREENVDVPYTFAGQVPVRAGVTPPMVGQVDAPWDPNILPLSFVEQQRLLVLPRGPLTSRPPSNFVLVERDADFNVWKRTARPAVLELSPFSHGGPVVPPPASCATVRPLGELARRRRAHLEYVPAPAAFTLIPSQAAHTPTWGPQQGPGDPVPYYLQIPQVTGQVDGTVSITAAGRYTMWVEGSLSRRMILLVNHHRVGTIAGQIGPSARPLQVGTIGLRRGPVTIAAVRPAATLAPGNLVTGDLLGPITLTMGEAPPAVRTLPAANWHRLCGRSLEWIEVVR